MDQNAGFSHRKKYQGFKLRDEGKYCKKNCWQDRKK